MLRQQHSLKAVTDRLTVPQARDSRPSARCVELRRPSSCDVLARYGRTPAPPHTTPPACPDKAARVPSRTTLRTNALALALAMQIVQGMDVVGRINKEHGEEPNQGEIQSKGNAYLKKCARLPLHNLRKGPLGASNRHFPRKGGTAHQYTRPPHRDTS